MGLLDGELFARFFGVLVVNLLLSGDNAVVIALAVRALPDKTRQRAIFWGATGAVALRLVFATIVTFLLRVPLLQAAGGVLLVWIAWKLIFDDPPGEDDAGVDAGSSLWQAIRIIIAADILMSLDNVIALVGVSGGNMWLLAIGLALTVPLVIFGATLLTSLINRFPVLVYAGAGLLVFVAVEMLFKDRILHEVLEPLANIEWFVGLGVTAVFLAVAWVRARRTSQVA